MSAPELPKVGDKVHVCLNGTRYLSAALGMSGFPVTSINPNNSINVFNGVKSLEGIRSWVRCSSLARVRRAREGK